MEDQVLQLLEEICENDIVRKNRDVDLFDTGLLDSLLFAELLVYLDERVGVIVSPSEIEREDINTPNKIIALVQSRS